MCITRDLHCDGVVHCLDASDETYNCSNFGDFQIAFNYPLYIMH